MIHRESAIRITSDSFPNGPEELAKALSVIVSASPLVGVDHYTLGKYCQCVAPGGCLPRC